MVAKAAVIVAIVNDDLVGVTNLEGEDIRRRNHHRHRTAVAVAELVVVVIETRVVL